MAKETEQGGARWLEGRDEMHSEVVNVGILPST